MVAQSILLTLLVISGPVFGQKTSTLNFIAGLLLFAIGAFTGILGVKTLGVNRTAFPRPKAEAHLVSTGIYALIRHPLYSSLILAGFGWALIWGSWVSLAIALCDLVFFDQKARQEEKWLHDHYTAYHAYSRRTRRLFPGIY